MPPELVKPDPVFDPPYTVETPQGSEMVINGRRYNPYFGGGSYFGLHADERLMQAGIRAWRAYGHGMSGGNSPVHVQVVEEAARFFGAAAAAYMGSGFLVNFSGAQALRDDGAFDVVFLDEHAHYSVNLAAAAIGAPVHRFVHMDPEDLKSQLGKHLQPSQRPLVMSDGLFPARGRIAPVPDYVEILEPYEGSLWLDDAHGIGILGANGRGTYEHFGLAAGERMLFGGSMAKAFGGFGGVITGSVNFIERVRGGPVGNGASPPPVPAAAATLTAMQLLAANPGWREGLWANARLLKEGISGLGFEVEPTDVPIVAIALDSMERMRRVHRSILERGIMIQHIFYPGAGSDGMLRMVVTSDHTREHIGRLIEELGQLL